MVAYNTLQVAAIDALAGRPVDMRRAWRFTVRGRVLGTLILWYVAILASMFCCCLPVLFVVPLLAFVPAVMVGRGAVRLSRRSRAAPSSPGTTPPASWRASPLVKVFLLLLVGGLLAYLAALLVSAPLPAADVHRHIPQGRRRGGLRRRGCRAWVWLQVPAQFLSSLVSTAVYLYVCFGVAMLFYDIRGRKEGSDLRAEIESAFPGAGEPPPPPFPREPGV